MTAQSSSASDVSAALLRDLARVCPRLRTSDSAIDRSFYARDLWPRHHLSVRAGEGLPGGPTLIAWPGSANEIAELVAFARPRGIPIVPFGAGSGVCGGVLPTRETIVLDLKRLPSTVSTDAEAMRLRVDAGALGLTLEEELGRRSLTLGHFPSSILCSTVGGWVATRSAGQCSGYYGKIEDMVVSVECVTGTGELIELARRTSGPDLSALVVGSEGALAIITAATLRVHPAPQDRSFGAFSFRDLPAGLEAMRAIYQAGLRPAVCRLYDPFDANIARSGRVKKKSPRARSHTLRDRAVRAAIAHAPILNSLVHGAIGDRVFGGALLVLVFERAESRAAGGDLLRAREIALKLHARDEGEGPARRWMEHRYAISFRQAPTWQRGLFLDTYEVAAPWSKLEAVHEAVHEALREHAFVMAHFSHAYPDGCCIYFSFAGTAPTSVAGTVWEAESRARYEAAWRNAMDAAISAGATVSHHHGVGRSKARGFAREIVGGVETVRALKRAFDPDGILNPGVLEPSGGPDTSVRSAEPSRPNEAIAIDAVSGLVSVAGAIPLREIETTVSAQGFRLRRDSSADASDQTSIAEWLARGAPGSPSPFVDPVDHVVAGIALTLPGIGRVVVPPVPRRATGPDFGALAVGACGAFGATIDRAWLRVDAAGAAPAPSLAFVWNSAAPLSSAEKDLAANIANAISRAAK